MRAVRPAVAGARDTVHVDSENCENICSGFRRVITEVATVRFAQVGTPRILVEVVCINLEGWFTVQ